MKKILLASDHAGFELKEEIQKYVTGLGYVVEDLGPLFYEPNDDYPDYIRPLAKRISKEPDTIGIIFGGSGQGEAIVANRVSGVRCAVFYGPMQAINEVDVTGQLDHNAFEIIKLEKLHNDANVLSIGARFVSIHDAKEAVKLFLTTEHIPDERHDRRIKKIDQ